MSHFVRAAATVVCWMGLSSTASAQPGNGGAVGTAVAISDLLDAWRDHSVVVLGEIHYSRLEHDFIARLIHDPAFARSVNDIVVEFGNARYQPLLDRFIAGDNVPNDSLRLIWRNTTQFFVWDSPLYEELLRSVRELNLTLPSERRLRVLGGDPPVDWDQVRTAADFPPAYGYRDPDTFAIVEREVISRNRKALVLIGNGHLPRREVSRGFAAAPLERAGLGDALAQRYPGRAFLVWASTTRDSIARLLPHQNADLLLSLKSSAVGQISSHVLVQGNVIVFRMVNGKRVPVSVPASEFPPLASQIDAVLFLSGTPRSVFAPSHVYCEEGYVTELYRRAAILKPVFGYDFGDDLDALVLQARQEAALGARSCEAHLREKR